MGNAKNWVVAAGGATSNESGGPSERRVPGKVGAAGEPNLWVEFSDASFISGTFFFLQRPPTRATTAYRQDRPLEDPGDATLWRGKEGRLNWNQDFFHAYYSRLLPKTPYRLLRGSRWGRFLCLKKRELFFLLADPMTSRRAIFISQYNCHLQSVTLFLSLNL